MPSGTLISVEEYLATSYRPNCGYEEGRIEDRMSQMRDRIDDYLTMGVGYVWLFDPSGQRVYVETPEAGLHEFKGDVLRTENPALELPLAEAFA
jgi:hypothetical protein